MTTVVLYLKNGIWCYKTPGGEMWCPPHLFSRQDCRRFFGPEYDVQFVGEERKKERKERVRREHDIERLERPTERKPRVLGTRKPVKMGRPERQVAQYTLDGRFIRLWNSGLEAAKAVGCERTAITKCCSGTTRSSKNFYGAGRPTAITRSISTRISRLRGLGTTRGRQ